MASDLPGSTITSIQLRGLNKTRESFVRMFLECYEGVPYDSLQMEQAAQRLRNLQLFSRVECNPTLSDSGMVVQITFREFRTLVPMANFGGIEGNTWFQIGLADYNWLGRGQTLGGYYRYYDRHSFELFLRSPYLFSNTWGLSTTLASFATTEPAYFETGATEYDVDRRSIGASVRYSLSPLIFANLGGSYLFERYEKNTAESIPDAPGPELAEFTKYLANATFTHDGIDYLGVFQSGIQQRLELEAVKTKDESDVFWKALYVGKLIQRIGLRGNTAIRMRCGLSKNKITVFVPFVLDSYVNVRGSGNRIGRGSAELTINVEHRHVLFDGNWWAVQGVAFLDWSGWRRPGKDLSTVFDDENIYTFAGLGARFFHWKTYNIVLRVDYGLDVKGFDNGGLVVGLGQYF